MTKVLYIHSEIREKDHSELPLASACDPERLAADRSGLAADRSGLAADRSGSPQTGADLFLYFPPTVSASNGPVRISHCDR